MFAIDLVTRYSRETHYFCHADIFVQCMAIQKVTISNLAIISNIPRPHVWISHHSNVDNSQTFIFWFSVDGLNAGAIE